MFCENGANLSCPVSKMQGPPLAPAAPQHGAALSTTYCWKSALAQGDSQQGGIYREDACPSHHCHHQMLLPRCGSFPAQVRGEAMARLCRGHWWREHTMLVEATGTELGEDVHSAKDVRGGGGGRP